MNKVKQIDCNKFVMIVLPSIDEQKKCPRAVKCMFEGKFCWNLRKQPWKKILP